MRTFSAATLAALESGRYVQRSFVRVDLDAADGGSTGIWDDLYAVTVGGVTYSPAAGRFTVAPVTSSADLSVRNCDVTLSNLDSGRVAVIKGLAWHQRPVLILLGVAAVETPQAMDVYPWFWGVLDSMVEKDKPGGTADLVFRCESANREINRATTRHRTDADQRQIDPTDGFFKHVTTAVSETLQWGKPVPPQPATEFFRAG